MARRGRNFDFLVFRKPSARHSSWPSWVPTFQDVDGAVQWSRDPIVNAMPTRIRHMAPQTLEVCGIWSMTIMDVYPLDMDWDSWRDQCVALQNMAKYVGVISSHEDYEMRLRVLCKTLLCGICDQGSEDTLSNLSDLNRSIASSRTILGPGEGHRRKGGSRASPIQYHRQLQPSSQPVHDKRGIVWACTTTSNIR